MISVMSDGRWVLGFEMLLDSVNLVNLILCLTSIVLG